MNKIRVFSIDYLRGIAIVLMVLFHICFNLNHFNYIDINIYRGIEWRLFRAVIVTIFLTLVGVSLVFAYKNGIKLKKLFKRLSILFVSALMISIVTKFIFPQTWIYFGVIHFIFVASILALIFIPYPYISLVVGISIIVGYFLNILSLSFLYQYLQPILNLPRHSEDLVTLFPWFGVVLIGIFLANIGVFEYIKIKENYLAKKIALAGKHSLIIYLIHQPILFGSLLAVDYIKKTF